MKKSRPATKISVLCNLNKVNILKNILFENSTTLGIREIHTVKSMLKREEKSIDTIYGIVRIKECFLNGKTLRFKPEYEDCKELAIKHNLSISVIENEVFKTMNNAN